MLTFELYKAKRATGDTPKHYEFHVPYIGNRQICIACFENIKRNGNYEYTKRCRACQQVVHEGCTASTEQVLATPGDEHAYYSCVVCRFCSWD